MNDINHNQPTYGDKQQDKEWISMNSCVVVLVINSRSTTSPTKHKKANGRQPEEDKVRGDYVIKDVFVPARAGDYHCQNTLQDDGYDGHASFWMYPAHTFKEQAVLGHSEVDAWRGQHTLAKKSQGRNRNAGSNQTRSGWAEGNSHHIRCRRCGVSKS